MFVNTVVQFSLGPKITNKFRICQEKGQKFAHLGKKTMTHLVLQLLQCYSSKTDSTQVKN